MAGHRANFKRYNKGRYNYVTSFELLKYDDAYIELIELYPCNSKTELDRGEGIHIRQLDCVNKRIEGRTRAEWIEDNKEEIKEKLKDYYQNNKEQHNQYSKEYRQNNKKYFKEYNKQYRKDNREKIAERKKQYYQDNREQIKEQANKKFDCECGGKYTHGNKPRHLRSKKHQKYLNK
jgi:hypothetical protein